MMMSRHSNGVCVWLLSLACLGGFAGCGSGGAERPDTVPVDGTVTYNNKPVEGATVSFSTEGSPRVSSGVTDAEGKFQLTMYDPGDGVMVGEHTVTIAKSTGAGSGAMSQAEMEKALNDPSGMAGQMQAQEAGKGKDAPKSEIPEEYASGMTSGLKATVTAEGPNTFPFQLAD